MAVGCSGLTFKIHSELNLIDVVAMNWCGFFFGFKNKNSFGFAHSWNFIKPKSRNEECDQKSAVNFWAFKPSQVVVEVKQANRSIQCEVKPILHNLSCNRQQFADSFHFAPNSFVELKLFRSLRHYIMQAWIESIASCTDLQQANKVFIRENGCFCCTIQLWFLVRRVKFIFKKKAAKMK